MRARVALLSLETFVPCARTSRFVKIAVSVFARLPHHFPPEISTTLSGENRVSAQYVRVRKTRNTSASRVVLPKRMGGRLFVRTIDEREQVSRRLRFSGVIVVGAKRRRCRGPLCVCGFNVKSKRSTRETSARWYAQKNTHLTGRRAERKRVVHTDTTPGPPTYYASLSVAEHGRPFEKECVCNE